MGAREAGRMQQCKDERVKDGMEEVWTTQMEGMNRDGSPRKIN